MHIIDTLEGVNVTDRSEIERYWDSELMQDLYFGPKRIAAEVRVAAFESASFGERLREVAALGDSGFLASRCAQLLDGFSRDTGYALPEGRLYLVLGCATTTIYTATVDGEDASVLCVESLGGDPGTLTLYLAHEYTHFVRKALRAGDIFESSVGERLVTEGIAESYSRDRVPGRRDSDYCIVSEETVSWVDTHRRELEAFVRGGLESTDRMEPLFYMFAQTDFPVRTGYVLGYRAVRGYLEEQGLETKDILGIDWHRILGGNS